MRLSVRASQGVSMRVVPAGVAQRSRLLFGLLFAAAVAFVLPATSAASMPGNNGRLAFEKFTEKGEFDFEVQIYSANPDGSGITQLTSGKDSTDAAYSPDGSRLVFDHFDELWTAAADGSGARVLSPGNDRESERTRWVHNYEDPETGEVIEWVKIEEEREERDAYSEASFSPDGTSLAVVHYTGAFAVQHICQTSGNGNPSCSGPYNETEFVCDDCHSSIDAIDSVTAAPLGMLVPRSTTSFLSRPTYSSTGALAYEEIPDGKSDQREIRVIPSPGAASVVVASGEVGEPDFSPDGSRVAFASGRHDIGIVAATGGVPTIISAPAPVAEDQVWSARTPVWSPDGSLIAFGNIGARQGMERYSDGGVYLMHPDGSGMTQIQGDATTPNSWQPIPIPPPAPQIAARAVKGKKKVKLNKKGIGVVGKVVCGSSPCALKTTKAKLKVGKQRFGVKALSAKSLAPGAVGQLKIKVKGKALAALRSKHRGLLALTVSVTDATGTQSLTFKPKVLPPKKKR
jgi:WD40-like Beta Propeller Repeat